MLLVYAMTRATQIGWGTAETIGLLTGSAALIVAFVVIELRSKAPLLPMRIFRLRTLTGANVTAFLLGTSVFSQFFLGTLYMQQVLHYSAIETGVAYLPLTLTIIVFANVSQNVVTRIGVRRVLPVGLAVAAVGLLLLTQLPPDGHYFFDLFPAFIVSAVGLAFTFVPMTIAALMGVEQADAGVASGLLNTSQQIGGAVGLAAASTIATTFTARYVEAHPGASPLGAAALTHGFQITFYVLTGLAALAAVLGAVLIEPHSAAPAEEAEFNAVPIEEAA
jgi:predicted MFS family arabinose efflux permease